MMRMIRKFRTPIFIFLVVSLFAHFAILLTLHWLPDHPPQKVTSVDVQYVTPKELAEIQKKNQAEKKHEKTKNEIVDQKIQLNHELDQNTHHLSAFTQKVLHETRAARSGEFRNTAKGGQPDEGQKSGSKKSLRTAKKTSKAHKIGDLPLENLMPKFALTPGPKGLDMNNPGDPSQTDDYLKNVPTGMQTLLSTREFIYFAYYSRIKQAIRQRWEPAVREKVKIIYAQGRSIASARDRVTQVLVTLNAKGELISVKIIGRSGVQALDAAAIEAFRQAAPFPNPPKGMIERDGTVKIRWDFVLEA